MLSTIVKVHSTLYRALPADGVLKRYLGPWIPPIAYTLYDKIRRR